MLSQKIERLLDQVSKPARYSGGELNTVVKDPGAVQARFAFCFPDAYEVGMSHLGIKILYHAINQRPEYACERVFAPWPDMEALMRENDVPLFSLETRCPVREFDFVGFTLQYEMSYTNILNMLDLAGIPLLSADRTEGPFVVAGGPCACNPETLADFIDVFMIGDGEEIITQLMDLYCDWRKSGEPREAFLLRCARTRGLYVPRFYAPSEQFGAVTPLRDDVPKVIDKCMIENLSDASFPDRFFVPFTETVFDRVMLEIARGCTRGCRFCQAGYIYRPVRERSVERLLEQTQSILRATGYEEVSLSSLSSGDYSQLTQLTHELVRRYRDDHVNITLPSLRIDSIVKDALLDVGAVRKSSLTFAPEAGTQRLRDVINKGVTQDDLIRSVGDAFEAGYTNVKLYFMIGLPTETDEDLLGIAQLAKAVRERDYQMPKEQRPAPPRVGASASTFVPKPHTAFQWEPQRRWNRSLKNSSFCARRCASRAWTLTGTSRIPALWKRRFQEATVICARCCCAPGSADASSTAGASFFTMTPGGRPLPTAASIRRIMPAGASTWTRRCRGIISTMACPRRFCAMSTKKRCAEKRRAIAAADARRAAYRSCARGYARHARNFAV